MNDLNHLLWVQQCIPVRSLNPKDNLTNNGGGLFGVSCGMEEVPDNLMKKYLDNTPLLKKHILYNYILKEGNYQVNIEFSNFKSVRQVLEFDFSKEEVDNVKKARLIKKINMIKEMERQRKYFVSYLNEG